MEIKESRKLHEYKNILEGLVEDFGYIYYDAILKWCGVIDDNPDSIDKYWQVWIIQERKSKEKIRRNFTTIGICGLWSQKKNSIKELWLGWFGIIPEYRNKKIGEKALKWMEAKAKKMGCKKILTYVDKDDKPLNFYYRNGYKRICSVKEYLERNPKATKDDFEDLEDHVIEKKLK